MKQTVVQCDRCGNEGNWEVTIRSKSQRIKHGMDKNVDLCDNCYHLLNTTFIRFIKSDYLGAEELDNERNMGQQAEPELDELKSKYERLCEAVRPIVNYASGVLLFEVGFNAKEDKVLFEYRRTPVTVGDLRRLVREMDGK